MVSKPTVRLGLVKVLAEIIGSQRSATGMKNQHGWDTNEGLTISILAHRNAEQRKLIRRTDVDFMGKIFSNHLRRNLSDFERAVLLWTLDPAEHDAFLAYESIRMWTASNRVILEMACTRSPFELLLARQAYHARYKKSLEEDVAAHTKGNFRKVNMSCVFT
ncbi:hypothetical protein Syun_004081 [Stephania yunnanensis]|uniref:Uncharacterized protein n=1 Tax=Stephania yunnanensis TaxID=152371 RepID=A0AAP0Q275_9MAGN